MTDSTTRQVPHPAGEPAGSAGGPALLFGLPIAPLTLDETLALAARAIRDRERLLFGVVNAAKIAKLKADPVLRESLLDADVLLADGQPVVWASRLVRRPLPERVAGIDLFEALLASAGAHGHRVFLLGARPEVLERVQAVIHERWPGVVVAGARDGYFTPDQADEVAAEIRAAQPDLLFLGITTPKKETFLSRYADELGVPVMHGVGGSFDVMAGVTRRAPLAWQRVGMEWAYRVLQEPTRLGRRYLVTNVAFLCLVALELVRPHPGYARTPAPAPATAPSTTPPAVATAAPTTAWPAPRHVRAHRPRHLQAHRQTHIHTVTEGRAS